MNAYQALERTFFDCTDIERDIRQLSDDEPDPARARELKLIADRVRSVGENAVERNC